MIKDYIPAALFLILLLIFCNSLTVAGTPETYLNADRILGGILYDNWPKFKKVVLTDTHPLYPSAARLKGADTWRCNECHGWDYLGKDGRYGRGYYYTGIKGIFDARHKEPLELYSALTNKEGSHNFTGHLAEDELWALVKFIRSGQMNYREMLGPGGDIKGDPVKGRPLYYRKCENCHGSDGDKIFIEEHIEGLHGLGWESNSSPDEVIHKIRFSHSLITRELSELREKDILDIVSFCQTLYP